MNTRSNLTLQTNMSLTAALQNSTAGIALFDEGLFCAAVNSALSSMSGLSIKACVGRTVRQMFGRQSDSFERALQSVRDTERPLRAVRVDVEINGSEIANEWVADLFPLRDASRTLRWIGAAFSEPPRKSGLQRDLLDLAHGNGALRDSGAESSDNLEADEIEETFAPLLSRTFSLLDNSMSLRRQVCQERVAASLGGRWPRADAPFGQFVSQVTLVQPRNDRPEPNDHEAAGEANRSGPLSLRETEVLRFIAQGRSNKEIAVALTLSIRTIETYRARLMRKLGFHSLADVIRYAIRKQLIEV